ncbi:hypothetical protein PL960_09060 [Bifidobacterium adolescentis]|nr:hypothetical protein [Bifidobacterium adolescentis]MDB1502405.1 hypothetical protein [Bifidobacterium adolescentis]
MTNLLYALTDHDHTENELTPWLAECATGDEMADGLILTALDCAWGSWEFAAGPAIHPYADPEYLKAAEESLWRWNDWIPAGLFDRDLDKTQWHRLITAMNDLGRFGLSDTAVIRRGLSHPFDEGVLAIRDDWELADFEACEWSDPNASEPYECAVYSLRLLAGDMDREPRHMGGLVRYRTQHALAGFDYLTFKA